MARPRERPSPLGVHQSSFGPNLSALIVLLFGEYRMSRRNIQRFIADSHGIDVSLDAISDIERRMAERLTEAHSEALASVAASPTKHLKETTWREFGERLLGLTVAVTLRKAGRSLRDFIGEVARAVLQGQPPPKLLS